MLSDIALIIKDVVVIVAFLSSIITILVQLKAIGDANRCMLRSNITGIYYRHVDEDVPTLREYERKNLDDLYAGYHTLKGNHFVDDLYRQMREWKVIT